MRKIVKMTVLFTVLFFISVSAIQALFIRNIFVISLDVFPNKETASVLENTAIVKVHPNVSLLGKGRLNIRTDGSQALTTTVGGVYLLGNYGYGQLSYGLEFEQKPQQNNEQENNDKLYIHHIYKDFTREQEAYLLNAGITGLFMVGKQTRQIYIPSVAMKYVISPYLFLWGKYFLIYDSDRGIDHSAWIEGGLSLSPKITVKIGGTGSTNYIDDPAGKSQPEISGLAGIGFNFSEGITINYQFQYYHRFTDNSGYQVYSNTISLDTTFR